jgi:transposase
MHHKKRFTKDQFIAKARSVHGDSYDYSHTIYIDNSTPLEIHCRVPGHGPFWQSPGNHCRGNGCPACSDSRRISKVIAAAAKRFLERAKSVHGDFYGYDETIYAGGKSVVSIYCPRHGSFLQVASSHLNGSGCPTCELEDEAAAKNKSLEHFKARAIGVHGNVYDYSKVEYVNLQTKVTIGCPIHGPFLKSPSQHLYGVGCPACDIVRRGHSAQTSNQYSSPSPANQSLLWSDHSAYPPGMPGKNRLVVLNDEQWAVLEPLVDECRPQGKTEPVALRKTIEAIIWRHQNGAKWRSVPPDLGPWWRAAQTFIRWSHLGVWERLLERAQERGVELGMDFPDGTSIRAHHKAVGALEKGDLEHSAMCVRHLVDLAAAIAPRTV